ncbi:hypothetical protein AAV94_12705 [Lampropedia cohaerens]|uniref:Primase C-terminal 1 domain-containing protein n=1 Tax=Lampropedia cohaerens TaxID=1610491 RepID=A0A0U1PWS8_9BURK|nr:replication initiation protein [Lampropedia cohaerens]KKW66931.1 hypothetical protein AAV94_12705 [Lampropedia cohaerens]
MSALPAPLEAFAGSVPHRAFCTDDPRQGISRSLRDEALKHPHIQPNASNLVRWIVLDVDTPGAARYWQAANCPAPSFTTTNPRTGHAHVAYQLAAPVPTTDIAHAHPIQYLAAVQHGLNTAWGGDFGYRGVVTQNPLHPHWLTECPRTQPYDLGELAEWVKLPTAKEMMRCAVREDYAGLGRNCYLFEHLRKASYQAVRKHWRPGGNEAFLADVQAIAAAMNATLAIPLTEAEVRAIARSVARWTWQRFTPEGFRQAQASRGARKGAAKRKELLERAIWLHTMGNSVREIAEVLSVSRSTVHDWLTRQ